MFTGIVQEVGSIVSVTAGRLTVASCQAMAGIAEGGSVAINGVCLTVTGFDNKTFTVEVIPETLGKTNLGLLKPGDRVNLERPLAFNGEIGGHLVQGHIDGTGELVHLAREGGSILMRFQTKPEIMRYIVPKGFIAVDGASLTVTTRDALSFGVAIIGYTREHTILADRKPEDIVNLEVDIIGKYVAEFYGPQNAGITIDFLREHGFPVN
jgi:riboflavin synthase